MEKNKVNSKDNALKFEVHGIYYHRLLEVIKAGYQSSDTSKYHWIPFKLFCKPSGPIPGRAEADVEPPEDIQVFTEIYNSDAMFQEDVKICLKLEGAAAGSESDSDLDVKIAIAPILVWSDSMHLANFGTASLWPIYVFFGSTFMASQQAVQLTI